MQENQKSSWLHNELRLGTSSDSVSDPCFLVPTEEVDRYETVALSRLKDLGLRVTGPRKLVLRALAASRKPLGAYQIRESVSEQGGKVDVVSVYRILAGLVEVGLVHHIGSVDGYLACTGMHTGSHQTEHLICTNCGCVEELPVPNSAISEIGVSAARIGFSPAQTRVEVLGVCSHCK